MSLLSFLSVMEEGTGGAAGAGGGAGGGGGVGGGGSAGSPLDYGADLMFFVDEQAGLDLDPGEGSNGQDSVISWTDQGPSGVVFTVPPEEARRPDYEEDSIIVPGGPNINGLTFQPSPNATDRKLINEDDALDELWGGENNFDRTIGFAARIDDLVGPTSAKNTICEKGFHRGIGGFLIEIIDDGSIQFKKRRENGSIFICKANGLYSNGDMVLGWFEWNGAAATGSARFRLWNGSQFATVGSVTSAGGDTIGRDTKGAWTIGNGYDQTNIGFDAAFNGTIFAHWATKKKVTQFNEGYLSRYLV